MEQVKRRQPAGGNRHPHTETRRQGGSRGSYNNRYPRQSRPRDEGAARIASYQTVPLSPKLKIYALGGLEEVGRNCTVFECDNDIVIVDMGLQFPEEDMPGIDYVIPDVSSLRGKEKNIRGLIVTHGHYDHIGGIPHVLGKLGNPIIYTAHLTAGMIRKRMEETPNAPKPNVQIITSKSRIQMGRNFIFEPFHINHNIFDAFGVALHTPYGVVLHTGDFKFDPSPINDTPPDYDHIASFGEKGVLALLSDSTSCNMPGKQISESVVAEEMGKIFDQAKGRLIIGTFSSLLTRVQIILDAAQRYNRRILVMVRSMQTNVELCHGLGYLKYKPGIFVEAKEASHLPDDKLVIVCTGAQGEKNAALMRMANDEDRFISLKKGDSIVFSSSVVPGNERTVEKLKDALVRRGAKIFHYQMMDIHAGGHAKVEDLKLMIQLTKPKYFVPVHSRRFRLQEHADIALGVGVKPENIFIADNGQIMEFDKTGGKLTDQKVSTEYIMVDGLGVGDVTDIVLRDRQMLAADGMFVVIVTIDTKTGDLIGNPDIISRGFVFLKENRELIEKTRAKVKKMLKDSDPSSPAFEDYIKNKIRNDVGSLLYAQTKRRPMVLPVLIEV